MNQHAVQDKGWDGGIKDKKVQDMSREELWSLFPIILSDYQPEWANYYLEEKAVIEQAAGMENIRRISHIGSTSVFGLKAKPTVDILLEIKKDCELNGLVKSLVAAGYIYEKKPENPAPHMMFMKGYSPRGFEEKVFHLHVRYQGDWDEIYFRDYLRMHPDGAKEYAALKTELQKRFTHDRDGYTQAKTAFIKECTAKGRAEKQRNYQKELDKILDGLKKSKEAPSLLLHSCCAPCSSYVLEYLSGYFQITVFYYNPNIYPESEFEKRVKEQEGLIARLHAGHPIKLLEGEFEQERFYKSIRGLEHIREGGERCFACYELRLEETATAAKRLGYDYFATTLSISPLKNAVKLNEIGERLAKKHGVSYLTSDFKKKNGYQRSIELSSQYGLYRQDYCGCIFSKREREEQNED